MILVSEGYYGAAAAADAQQPAGRALRAPGDVTRDPFAGDNNLLEDRAKFSADMDMLRELQDVFDACNRNNTVDLRASIRAA